ncbi:DUF6993 domain-containing protein [Pseudarthrobacter sp. N5]|uniref:DUF6993 domain-containing protein n=1 Tax=Pseudarthrobacter sp. N5 TaxID=3418416 RepID=UPI003CECE5EE
MTRANSPQRQDRGLIRVAVREAASRTATGSPVTSPAWNFSKLLLAAGLILGFVVACTGGIGQPSPGQSEATPAPAATSPTQTGSSATQPTAAPQSTNRPEGDPVLPDLQQRLGDALRSAAVGNPKPSRDQVLAALTGAGIPEAVLEVSASRTPTGLEVDAIEAAARQGKDCVVGQVRDGDVTVVVLPALANGSCFAGSAV